MPQSNEDDNSAPTLMEEMMMAASIGTRPSPAPTSKKANTATFGSGFKAGFLTKTSSQKRQSSSSSSSSSQSATSMSSSSSAPVGVVEKLSSSPTLRAALENPRFRVILSTFVSNPQATLARYQHDSAAMSILTELMGALGEHFEELGKQQQQQGQDKPNGAGPLVQAALEKANKQRVQPVDDLEQDKAEQEAVNRILQDPELRELLLDPAMQTVLQSCAGSDNGNGLARYTRDPAMAAKLRKLADAGLIQIK